MRDATTPLPQPMTHPRPLSPERRLMSAVLDDAIRCYLARSRWQTRGGRAVVDEIRRWMTADCCGSPFDFVVICETLGLDASATRERVETLRELEEPLPAAPRLASRRPSIGGRNRCGRSS